MLNQNILQQRSGFTRPRNVFVFGQSGMKGDIGQRLDFEFGDIITVNSPDDLVLQKFEGNFFFGYTFKGATVNEGIWTVSEVTGGTVTQANNIVTLETDNDNEGAYLTHKFRTRQSWVGDIVFEARVRRNAGGGNVVCLVGLSVGGSGTDRVVFELNTDENTWRPVIDRAGTTNGTDFTIPNNTWVKFRIEVSTDTAKFYVNDKHQQTLTGANVPDTVEIGMRFDIEQGVGGDNCALNIEWCKAEYGAVVI